MMTSNASQTTMIRMATPIRNAAGEVSMCEIVPVWLAMCCGGQLFSRAFTEISALKSFETGQPVSAAFTAASNFALSAPGTRATRSRWLLVIAKPSGSLSSVMVAVVSSLLAVMPALPSCAESAIVKQPACAAARSSSGLVPTSFSNLVLNEYCVCFSTPLSVEIEPFPSFKPPCQTADALRCMVSLLLSLSFDSNLQNSIPELLARVYSENELVEKALPPRMSAVLQEVAHRCWPEGLT